MLERRFERNSAARRARYKSELNKIRFYNVLYRARVLVYRRRERIQSRRSAVKLFDKRGQQLNIVIIQSERVYFQDRKSVV